MPRRCSVCDHPERAAIDAALVEGASYRTIAHQFSLSRYAVGRHAREHLPVHLAAAQEAATAASADDLLSQVEALRQKATRIGDKAEKAGDLRTALQGVRELVRIVELLARLQGELQEAPIVNILLLPEWVQVQTVLLAALAPFPDARAAAAAALVELDGREAHRG